MEWKEVIIGEKKIIKYYCKDDVYLMILAGSIENYGSEIPLGRGNEMSKGDYGILWSFMGCTIQFRGNWVHYVSSFCEEDFVPNICINIHTFLEFERARTSKYKIGPKVMICGNNSYGKTQLSRTLVNYKVRDLKKFVYIDAEVNYSDIGIPGSISAQVVSSPHDIIDGWNITDEVITFNFGHPRGINDVELYTLQLQMLSDLVHQKFRNDSDLRKSGFILNMDSLDDGDISLAAKEKRAAIIKTCIEYSKIDYVFVIDDGFLEKLIRKDLRSKTVVIRIPMPIQKINTYEEEDEMQSRILSSYFIGQGNVKIQLRTFKLLKTEFVIYRFESSKSGNDGRLMEPVEMKMSRYFLNSFLAISQAKEAKDISKKPIYGYVMVIGVFGANNDGIEGLKVVSPAAEVLPSNILLQTNIKSRFFS